MAERCAVGLRYCGGCNPRYDRVAAAELVRSALPETELRPAGPGQKAVLVVCGCPARCADVSGLDGELVFLCAPEQCGQAVERLRQAVCAAPTKK